MRNSLPIRCLLTFYTALLISNITSAALITWQVPFEIVTEADIATTNGSLIYALNAGDDRRSLTNLAINGETILLEDVAYNPDTKLNGPSDDNAFFGIIDDHQPSDDNNVIFDTTGARNVPELNGGDGSANITWDYGWIGGSSVLSRVYQQPTGNADLDSVLNSAIFTDARQNFVGELNITLRNLVSGRTYQVQLVSYADTRTGKLEQDWTFFVNDGTVSNPLDSVFGFATYQDLDSDGARHVTSVIGTFDADSTEQSIDIGLQGGRNPGISLLLLYDITVETTPTEANVPFPPAGIGLLAVMITLIGFKASRLNNHPTDQ